MRESRTYGSVRGARGNSRPYRERRRLLRCEVTRLALSDQSGSSAFRSLSGVKRTSGKPAENDVNDPLADIDCSHPFLRTNASRYDAACETLYGTT